MSNYRLMNKHEKMKLKQPITETKQMSLMSIMASRIQRTNLLGAITATAKNFAASQSKKRRKILKSGIHFS